MGLTTYRSCTFSEKREVLRAFWSRRVAESDKVNRAAREYGPYALLMVSVILAELALISVVLFSVASTWAWPALAATVLAGASTLRARECRRASLRPLN
ncbi:MAG TPA: hypothetical protein VLS91_05935 [Acidimicrobiales bacterium]|nr:hypothetical protein [Acidimicrobiales bacterium]